MKKLFKLLSFTKAYRGPAILNIVFNLLAVVFSLFSFTLLAPFLDLIFQKNMNDYAQILAKGQPTFSYTVYYIKDAFYYHFSDIILKDPEHGQKNALIFLCAIIGSCVFFKNLFGYLAMFFVAIMRNGIMRDLRGRLYNKITILPIGYFTKEKKGDIISRMSGDAQEIEWTVLTSIEMIFRDPIAISAYLIALIFISPKLTLFVFLLLPFAGFIIGLTGNRLKKASIEGLSKMGQLITVFEETIAGLRIIKGFNAEKVMQNKFKEMNYAYTQFMLKQYRIRDLASPLSEVLGVLVLIIIIWFGGGMILEEKSISPSQFILYIILFSQLIPYGKSLTSAYFNLQRGAASAQRIDEVLSVENNIKDIPHAKEIKRFENKIEIKNVSFSYGDQEVLSNINIHIEKGKTIALVGPSGGGKSTLTDLVARFYDPLHGDILIDGVSIREYQTKDVRSLMGIVSQDTFLFHDTVLSNIKFNQHHASKEEIIEAAKIANAHSFIMELEHGYDTIVGDRGSKLSGGQKQRISIARAILKNPSILILDEATSALDTESEKLVQDAIKKLMENRTSIVIAHRLSTIQSADLILVLEKGKIIESGSHTELLLNNGVYKKLFDLQSFS